jgi:hypothetical protein
MVRRRRRPVPRVLSSPVSPFCGLPLLSPPAYFLPFLPISFLSGPFPSFPVYFLPFRPFRSFLSIFCPFPSFPFSAPSPDWRRAPSLPKRAIYNWRPTLRSVCSSGWLRAVLTARESIYLINCINWCLELNRIKLNRLKIERNRTKGHT